MNPIDPLTFKFRWMEDGIVSGGTFALPGSFDGKTLILGEDDSLPVSSIVGIGCEENVIALVIEDDDDYRELSIVVSGGNANEVKTAIDVSRSHVKVADEQKRLIEQGQGASFRSVVCPHCGSSVSLSRFADTPQCYCDYCQTLFTIRGVYGSREIEEQTLPAEMEPQYRMCEKCGMYSHPRKFTVFYFVFLVYFVHWHSDKTVCCPGCMRWVAWKMLFGNIFGLLGLPLAFLQLFRSYRSRIEKGPLKGLDDANRLANRGKIDRALDRYDMLMDNLPVNAGIKYNIASGLLTKGDVPHAESMLLLSLEDCSNYAPSLSALHFCYESLGKSKQLEALEYQMGSEQQT